MRVAQILACSGTISLFAFAGCTKPLNTQVPILPADPPAAGLDSADPSLLGLSRTHWESVEVAPLVGAVEHRPTYVSSIDLTPSRRDGGGFPTTDNLWEPPPAHGRAALEGVVAPIHFGWLVLKLPYEMVVTPPMTVVRSGVGDYERSPVAEPDEHDWFGVRPAAVE